MHHATGTGRRLSTPICCRPAHVNRSSDWPFPTCSQVFQSDPVERVKKVAQEAVQKAPGNDAGPSLPKVNLPSGGGINLSLLTLPRESLIFTALSPT